MTSSKSKKANELNKALLDVKPKNLEQSNPMDSNIVMMQAFMQPFMQSMQQQNQAMLQQNQVFMEKITEKISGLANGSDADDRGLNSGNKKSNAKGHRPEKLEREVGHSTFLHIRYHLADIVII